MIYGGFTRKEHTMLKNLDIYDYDPFGLQMFEETPWDVGLSKLGNVVIMSWDDDDDDDDDEDDDDEGFGYYGDPDDDDDDEEDDEDEDEDEEEDDWIRASDRWIVCDEDSHYESDEVDEEVDEVIN